MRLDYRAHLRTLGLAAGAVMALVVLPTAPAGARPLLVTSPGDVHEVTGDLARGTPGYLDTLWFGGTGPDGLGVPGGVWDFEDGTVQGWTSEDQTDDGLVRRVEQSDFIGEPETANINGGSLWFGGFEGDEAAEGCWPGGMGYSNDWIATATKSFTYEGEDGIVLSFQYFVDSETQFDYSYVVLESSVGKDTLNTSMWADPHTGWGYSGANQEGTAIGSPDSPAFEQIVVPHSEMPPTGEAYTLQFRFDSDPLYSDGLDSFAGFLNSIYGPFGVDEVFVETPRDGLPSLFDISTFDIDYDGWMTGVEASGTFMEVVPIAQLDPIPMGPDCPLAAIGNEYALIAADRHGGEPHPPRQVEILKSPAIHVGPGSGAELSTAFLLEQSVFTENPALGDSGYRLAMDYYPWTCPTTGAVGWTVEPLDSGGGGFHFSVSACSTQVLMQPRPGTVDSVRVVIIVRGCEDFGQPFCGELPTNHTPAFDDIRVGVVAITGALRVPEHFATLAEAIDFAVDGATIVVGPGIYTEGIDTMGKAITIVSSDGPLTTIIDAGGLGPAATFDDGEGSDTVIEGFTFTGGYADSGLPRGAGPSAGYGGGLILYESSPTIRNCRVLANAAELAGGGAFAYGSSATFEDCQFLGNTAGASAGLHVESESDLTLSRCVIAGNQSTDEDAAAGIAIVETSFVEMSQCTITDNEATGPGGRGGVLLLSDSTLDISTSILRGNCGDDVEGWTDQDTNVEMSCCNVALEDFDVNGMIDINGELIDEDPLFCQTLDCVTPGTTGVYGLQPGSPCLAENSPCGQRIGALGDCSLVATDDVVTVTPGRVALQPAVPNPFNPTTRLRFDVPSAGAATLRVFDVSGQLVRTLVEDTVPAGRHVVTWDGRDDGGRSVSSGVYFYRLVADGVTQTRQMTLVK